MKSIVIERHLDVIKIMKEEAKANGLPNGFIGLRQFPLSRMATVHATGTDRNRDAKVYDDDGDCKMHISDPERITYMRVVDTTLQVPMSVPKSRQTVSAFDNLDFLRNLSPDRAHLLYNPVNIFRASENEFWFEGNPMDSLIAVVTVELRK